MKTNEKRIDKVRKIIIRKEFVYIYNSFQMKGNINKYHKPETNELLENAADILLFMNLCYNNNAPVAKKDEITKTRNEVCAILFGLPTEENNNKLAKFIAEFELKLNSSKIKDGPQKFTIVFDQYIKNFTKKKLFSIQKYSIKSLMGSLLHRYKNQVFNNYKDIQSSVRKAIFDSLKGNNIQTGEINNYTEKVDNEENGKVPHTIDYEENEFIFSGFIQLENFFMDFVDTNNPSEKDPDRNKTALNKASKKLESEGIYSEEEIGKIFELFYNKHKNLFSQ